MVKLLRKQTAIHTKVTEMLTLLGISKMFHFAIILVVNYILPTLNVCCFYHTFIFSTFKFSVK